MTEIELIERIRNDFEFFANNFLYIKTKKGNLVKFKLNKAQKKLLDLINKNKNKPIRIIILKARQLGISTFVEAWLFWKTTFFSNKNSLLIAHKLKASNNLLKIFNRFYDNLPEPLKPEKLGGREKKLEYPNLDSQIQVETAEAREDVGRSGTVHYLHISELAFYPEPEETMKALLQTVSEEPNTAIFIESTANGFNYFQKMWKLAKKGESDFIPFFVSWTEDEDYVKYPGVTDLDEYEKSLNLTPEQAAWRRSIIKTKFNGNPDEFKVEYPATPDEAFTTSGTPVFPAEICTINYNKCTNKTYLNPLGAGYKLHYEYKYDPLDIHRFVAGVDTSSGSGTDYSTIKVYDRKYNKVILTYKNKIEPDLLAHELKRIQDYFHGDIYFTVERNNHGLTTITKAYELGVNLTYQTKYNKGYQVSNKNELGFLTTSKTKPIIIDRLNEWIREGYYEDEDEEFWAEAMKYSYINGSMSAPNGENDDLIIASALMLECNEWLPSYKQRKKQEPVRIRNYQTVKETIF